MSSQLIASEEVLPTEIINHWDRKKPGVFLNF